jgi:hypothetical protein
MDTNIKFCKGCSSNQNVINFKLDKKGNRLKTCDRCRADQDRKRCRHNRHKPTCKDCLGGGICKHLISKNTCRECDLDGYIRHQMTTRIGYSLKDSNVAGGFQHMGCTYDEFKDYIEAGLKEGMTWQNYGLWTIEPIVPIKFKENGKEPTIEEIVSRLHHTNTHPTWKLAKQ